MESLKMRFRIVLVALTVFGAAVSSMPAPARAALADRFDGSPFSVGLTLAYTPVEYVTIHLTYATEDSVLGLGRADNTLSFGIRANF